MAELEKALFLNNEKKTVCKVQFNPNSLEYSYAKQYGADSAKQGKNQEEHQQQSSMDRQDRARLSMRLFYNGYTSETKYEDVREMIKPLRNVLCKTDQDRTEGRQIIFAWGSLGFKGYLDSMSVTYQMFAADGIPVRAEVSVSIEGDDEDLPKGAKKRADATEGRGKEKEQRKSFNWLFGT